LLDETFDFSQFSHLYSGVLKEYEIGGGENLQSPLNELHAKLKEESLNTKKFRQQLFECIRQEEKEKFAERLEKGAGYYGEILKAGAKKLLLYMAAISKLPRHKTELKDLEEVDQALMQKIIAIEKAVWICRDVMNGCPIKIGESINRKLQDERLRWIEEAREKSGTIKLNENRGESAQRKKKGKKKEKGDSMLETVVMYSLGMDLKSIAEKRSLALGTIEGHLVQAIESGKLKLEKVLESAQVEEISHLIKANPGIGFKALMDLSGNKFSFAQFRMVQTHMIKSGARIEI